MKLPLLTLIACGLIGGGVKSTFAADEIVRPVDLRCDYLRNPLGIDDLNPRLSWKITTTDAQRRGLKQTAYQLLVASRPALLDQDRGDLWDSSRVATDQSVHVPQGAKLHARRQYWWKVRIWDDRQQASAWSEPAFWSMGPLSGTEWQQAQWIGLDHSDSAQPAIEDLKPAKWLWFPEGNAAVDAPIEARYFRRSISLPAERKIRRAQCLLAGDDQCVLFVNGELVGTSRGHASLVGVDITGHLRPGANVLAAVATNLPADVKLNPAGWIGAMRVDFEEGPPLVVVSDRGWKSAESAVGDWQQPQFDDESWVPASELGSLGCQPWGIPWPQSASQEHRRLAARYLRRDFRVAADKRVRRGTVYVCGLGFFDLYVNGQLIGDQLMSPALSGYDKRALYVTFDVTQQLRTAENAIGVVLSNGRFFAPRIKLPIPMNTYGYPKLIAQLHLEYDDGSDETLVSDESWKISTQGPLRGSNEFDGEHYDARLEMSGWSAPGFDDSAWQTAAVVDPPGGRLEAQMVEPIRVLQEFKPVQLLQPKPGIWMADFGQAFYGVVRLRVSGPAGTKVSLRTSFNVMPDGTLNYHNDRSALNTDVYELRGEGSEVWHARFRGNATRWVQVEGFPGQPTTESFTGLVTHTDHEPAGRFACSNDLLNRVYENACWGTRMQNRSCPMEPDRDERMPWSGHPAKTSESEGWVFNVARFYDHFLHNYRVHQGTDGSLQEILPPYWTFNTKDIVWPSVATIIPDWYYNFYGDDRPLADNFEMMKRFVRYHEQKNLKPDATMDFCTYGDWVDTASIGSNAHNEGATSRPLIGTAYFYHNCRIIERAARLLGKSDEQRTFADLADRVYKGFNARFFDPQSGTYESKTQCAHVLALAFGLVPQEYRTAVINHLVHDIQEQHKGHSSVGLIGMQWLMQVLADAGHADVAYQIATRTERPSWGYMVGHGATSVWERWDTDTQDGGMNGESQKILSGNFEAWCYQTLGGINYDPEQPGFKHVVLRPQPVGDLKWVRAAHTSIYGPIESEWQIVDDRFQWKVVVPPNTTATARVPTTAPASVLESGRPARESQGVKLVEQFGDGVSYELEPGTYRFEAAR